MKKIFLHWVALMFLCTLCYAGSYLDDSGELKDDEGDEYMTTSGEMRDRNFSGGGYMDDSGQLGEDPYSEDARMREEKMNETQDFVSDRLKSLEQ